MRALLLRGEPKSPDVSIEDLPEDACPSGPVAVHVQYSSLNFKDGLAITGKGRIIRGEFPFVPGIDLAGEVIESEDDRFKPGDRVVGTGGGLGETRWGGYATMAWPDPDYLVKLPESLSFEDAMAFGTAGYTAMLAAMALQREGVSKDGDVLVTGATGGVGSLAVLILSSFGFKVVASTGSDDAHEYLTSLGAASVIARSELDGGAMRPMESSRWAGAVDTVGGKTLEAVIAQLGWHGTVAVCGNAGGAELNTTVYPFILRGVKMIGIDSNTSPAAEREQAWHTLGQINDSNRLEPVMQTIRLEDVENAARTIVEGKIRGRVVVKVSTR
jgi:acrylyl-CoA reductase (NADPH)